MKDENKNLRKVWAEYWRNYQGVTKIGAWSQGQALEKVLTILCKKIKNKKLKIIDLGCGEGRTLLEFKKNGFVNIIGVDYTKESLKICQKKGLILNKDIFFDDALKTRFNNCEFDLVFSEGLLEHYKDPTNAIFEMARISKKYILIIQPNHFSFYGLTIALLGPFLRNNVREFSFTKKYFVRKFKNVGFKLEAEEYTPCGEFFILLFVRN
ncbi:MAG: class I SAM-dependent methyltransferase [bacterium]|nr:class I SAM-dependent methyltransferase [bacterium]